MCAVLFIAVGKNHVRSTFYWLAPSLNCLVPSLNNLVPSLSYLVPSLNFLVPSLNYLVPIANWLNQQTLCCLFPAVLMFLNNKHKDTIAMTPFLYLTVCRRILNDNVKNTRLRKSSKSVVVLTHSSNKKDLIIALMV